MTNLPVFLQNRCDDDLRSEFGDEPLSRSRPPRDLADRPIDRQDAQRSSLPSKQIATEEYNKEAGIIDRHRFISMDAYSRHKMMVNDYRRYYGGQNDPLKRDDSRDKRDIDVIRDNHRFLWDESAANEDGGDTSTSNGATWGQRLAKRYYDKLFKEYCIGDLSQYKHNRIALRWRIEKEVISGKGQFSCAAKRCCDTKDLRSWEVNFAYLENGTKKNALVKIRLCPDCSYKLNYKHRKKEVKHISKLLKKRKSSKEMSSPKNKKSKRKSHSNDDHHQVDDVYPGTSKNTDLGTRESDKDQDSKQPRSEVKTEEEEEDKNRPDADEVWSKEAPPTEEITREDEFHEYFDGMFL